MRDAILLVMLVGATLWSLKSPWIGVMSWTLVSLMSPHAQFGYAAANWPVAIAIALCTLVGALATKDRWNPFVGAPVWWLLIFCVWICITLPGSIFFDDSYPLWERSMKIFLMVFVTLMLVNTRYKLEVFIWVCVVSIAYYGVKGGVFTLATGGNYRVWGPGGFIEGNNEVALAVITVIPLMRYLQMQLKDKRARIVMGVSIGLCVIMALGTYSRGALLGVICMGLFMWWKSANKVRWGLLILLIAAMVPTLMPDQWFDRMDTIKTYNADASAMGRINAWWMAYNLAKDRVLGGGFMIWTGTVFQQYAPDPDDPHAAHSIYFQVMGEHGFIGFFIFMAIGVTTWMSARRLIRAGRADPANAWAAQLGPMIQVSMIGYATTGAFLSLAYFDLPYNVMVMSVVAERLLKEGRGELVRPSVAAAKQQQPSAPVTPS